jgi:hypothetical protein
MSSAAKLCLLPKDDRRRCLRAPLKAPLVLETGEWQRLAYSENVSENGLLIRTPQTPTGPRVVGIRMALPTLSVISFGVYGLVMRVQAGQSMAVRFFGLRARYREAIAEFVEQTLEKTR